MTLVVNLSRQRVEGYRGTDRVFYSRISSGKRGHRTPTGVFSIIQRRRRHYSNLYNNAPMPNMQRLTWSGIAFHGGAIPGYPASHGCVRLPYGMARKLFGMARMNTHVVVSYATYKPQRINHPLLWDRLPPGEPLPDADPDNRPIDERAPRSGDQIADLIRDADTRNGAERDETVARVMSSVLGASAAEAREADGNTSRVTTGSIVKPQPPRTRAEVERRNKAELIRAEAAKARAENAVALAEAVHEQARKQLREHNLATRRAARAVSRVERLKARAERVHRRVVRKMKALFAANLDAEPALAIYDELAEKEDALQAALSDAAADVRFNAHAADQANVVLRRLEEELPATRTAYERAKASLADAKAHDKKLARTVRALETEIKRFDAPVHMLISRRTGKIHIRQGYIDIYEAPVTFRDPDRAIGTHLLTAVAEGSNEMSLSWSALRVQDTAHVKRPPKTEDVLDNIELSPEVNQRVRELIKVGSTLTISDRKASHETGKGTNFVVLTRG